jgi:hypothetical protein
VEANCHFLEFPTAKADAPRVTGELFMQGHPNWRPIIAVLTEPTERQGRFGDGGAIHAVKSVESNGQGVGRQVPLYCFRLGKCGTFMPLSGVRGESRIAFAWTLFVTVFSASLSVHFSILFTHAVVLSAVDCG